MASSGNVSGRSASKLTGSREATADLETLSGRSYEATPFRMI